MFYIGSGVITFIINSCILVISAIGHSITNII